jgi:hypothetical protein
VAQRFQCVRENSFSDNPVERNAQEPAPEGRTNLAQRRGPQHARFWRDGVERFFIEFLRDDPGRGEVFGGLMTGTQLISIFLVIGGGLIWWFKSGAPKRVPAQSGA